MELNLCFILSATVIGLPCHPMIVLRKSYEIYKLIAIFSANVFQSYKQTPRKCCLLHCIADCYLKMSSGRLFIRHNPRVAQQEFPDFFYMPYPFTLVGSFNFTLSPSKPRLLILFAEEAK